jgi:hypothetical protein
VVASAAAVALGAPIADPLIGLGITAVILKITWDSWWTVRAEGKSTKEAFRCLKRHLVRVVFWAMQEPAVALGS